MVVTVTIPEGMTVHQIGAEARQQPAGLRKRIRRGGARRADRRGAGAGAARRRGLSVSRRPIASRRWPTADQILTAMLGRFYEILTPAVEQRLFELDLTAREMVTMASIIEKEAHVPGERPTDRERILQPPASSGCRCNPIRRRNIICRARSSTRRPRCGRPRPTTLIISLGCRRGRSRIRDCRRFCAALYPAHTDYLYFVARSDGTHIFSRSFEEHQRAIAGDQAA